MVFNVIKYILIMGLLSFVGDVVQDVFGGSKSRQESAEYNAQALAQQQEYAQQNMETQQGYNIQNMMMQQAFNRQNMTYQNQLNIEAFNRENAYNTPLQQRLRSQAAGINQNWQDGAGVVAQQDSGVSSQTPSGGMPSPSVPGVPGVSSSLADPTSLIEGVMHLRKFKNEQDLLKEQIKTEQAKQRDLLGSAREHDSNADQTITLLPIRKQQLIQTINNLSADERKSLAEANVTEQEAEWYAYRATQEVREISSRADYELAMKTEIMRLIDEKEENLQAEIKERKANAIYTGILAKYKPFEVAAAQTQAAAAQQQARAALWNAKTNQFLSNSQDKINKALSGKYSVEAAHEIIDTAVAGIEFKVSRDIANEKLPQKAAFLKNREAKAIISRYKSEVLKNMSGTWQGRSRIASDAVTGSDDAFDKMCQELNDLFEE